MSRKWNFSTPRNAGVTVRQAHAHIPAGLWERELGREGFSGAVADFYHRNPPTAWQAIDSELQPHLLDTAKFESSTNSPWDAAELLVNNDCRFRYWRTAEDMDHLVRNSDGDELLFVHRGHAHLFCDFGHIELTQGDYFVLPRGVMWRIETAGELEVLLVEATNGGYSLPDSPSLGRHIPFDPGVLGVPDIDEAFKAQDRSVETVLRVKRGNRVGSLTFPFNPLDAEGWQGDLYPIRLSISDLRPIHSFRGHLVPSAYTTFVSEKFVVCTFTPYPSPTDPDALKLPSFHDNVDFDEVMFMHDGSKTHRVSAFRPGALTFHPAGVAHGPHPAALPLFHQPTAMPLESTYIMIDTRNPLEFGRDGEACSVDGYGMSWASSADYAPDAPEELKTRKSAA